MNLFVHVCFYLLSFYDSECFHASLLIITKLTNKHCGKLVTVFWVLLCWIVGSKKPNKIKKISDYFQVLSFLAWTSLILSKPHSLVSWETNSLHYSLPPTSVWWFFYLILDISYFFLFLFWLVDENWNVGVYFSIDHKIRKTISNTLGHDPPSLFTSIFFCFISMNCSLYSWYLSSSDWWI